MGMRQDNGSTGANSGGGALFDAVSGGAAASSGAGGQASAGSGDGAGGGSNESPGAGSAAAGASKVEIPQNWKDALPPELRDAGFMKNVTSIETLAKNYANAQQMIGAEKIPLPGKDATPEQWRAVYERLGLPKNKEEYNPDFSKDVKVDPEFLGKFKEAAYNMGVLPNQAKQVVEWFDKVNQEAFQKQVSDHEASVAKGLDDLKKEWGQAYDQKIAAAKSVLSLADPEIAKQIRESGQGNNPALIKLLSEIAAKTMTEAQIKGGGQPEGKYSPEEARAMLREYQGNANSAYYNAADPGHTAAVKKVRELSAMAYPGGPAN